MNFDSTTMFHAVYVAFVFTCMFFGALAFRQVLDNMAIKAMRMGENRQYFLSAPGIVFVILGLTVSTGVGIIAWRVSQPTVYIYALPLILCAQCIQLGLRLYFQRTQVTTLGIVVRPLLLEKQRAIRFEDILHVYSKNMWLWTRITLYSNTPEPVVFRIFRFSWLGLRHILQVSCSCPVE